MNSVKTSCNPSSVKWDLFLHWCSYDKGWQGLPLILMHHLIPLLTEEVMTVPFLRSGCLQWAIVRHRGGACRKQTWLSGENFKVCPSDCAVNQGHSEATEDSSVSLYPRKDEKTSPRDWQDLSLCPMSKGFLWAKEDAREQKNHAS